MIVCDIDFPDLIEKECDQVEGVQIAALMWDGWPCLVVSLMFKTDAYWSNMTAIKTPWDATTQAFAVDLANKLAVHFGVPMHRKLSL
jgi:hypothetical protein